MTQEPFFRSMIIVSARCSLSRRFLRNSKIDFSERMLKKLQIPIPLTLGRSMFGVVDETGELEYGQVFVRYTKNAMLKFPGKNAERITHLGKKGHGLGLWLGLK